MVDRNLRNNVEVPLTVTVYETGSEFCEVGVDLGFSDQSQQDQIIVEQRSTYEPWGTIACLKSCRTR